MAERNPRWPRWTLASVLALAAVGGAAWWGMQRATTAPVAAVDAFLTDLEAGRDDRAWSRLCAADRERVRRAEFPDAVADARRGLAGHDVFSFDPVGDRRDVHYELDYGARTERFDVEVVSEDGAWRLCNFFAS